MLINTKNLLVCIFLCLCFYTEVTSQCNNCEILNYNGDFEAVNNIAGAENAIGISYGEIKNWYATHGTADFFDQNWSWYNVDGIKNKAGHICYGNRPAHDHSEGMYTEVPIEQAADINYCLSFQLAKFCEAPNNGKLHVYLANNLEKGSSRDYSVPTNENHQDWFEDALKLGEIILDDSFSFGPEGMKEYQFNFRADKQYGQLWFFTEYLYDDGINVTCGVMVDNVEIKGELESLTSIQTNQINDKTFRFVPVVDSDVEIENVFWTLGNGVSSSEFEPEFAFDEGSYNVCMTVTDIRGACNESCTVVAVGDFEMVNKCDYSSCLDVGGVPQLREIKLVLPNGESKTLNEKSNGLYFPYCISNWSMCQNAENELSYFIEDMNRWIGDEGYSGTVKLGGDDSTEDGCRSNILYIEGSDLVFESLGLLTTTDDGFDLMFETNNCKQTIKARPPSNTKMNIKSGPNPTMSYVEVAFLDSYDDVGLKIFNTVGNVMIEETLGNVEAQKFARIDMSSLKSGIYYIQLSAKGYTKTFKQIKT